MTDTPNLPAPVDLDLTKMAKLAREIVIKNKDLDTILRDFSIDRATYDTYIVNNDFFKRTLETYTIEWNGALGTQQRIQVRSAAALEDGLIPLAVRMNDADEPLPAVVEVAKLFTKMAGMDTRQGAGGSSGEKFVITIDLGEDKKLRFEKDITPIKELDLEVLPTTTKE